MAFHRQPLFFLVLGLVAGTLVPLSEITSTLHAAIGLGALIGVCAVIVPARTTLTALIIAAGAAGAGLATAARVDYQKARLPAPIGSVTGAVLIEGRIDVDPIVSGDEMRLDLGSNAITAEGVRRDYRGRIRVFVRGLDPLPTGQPRRFSKGDVVTAWVDLRAPQAVRTPGGFDQAAWAMREGLHAFATCKNERLIQIVGTHTAGRPLLDRVRDQLRHAWRHVPDAIDRAVTSSMVLGDEGALDQTTRDEFRASGLLHLLVVSGSQVAALIFGLRRLLPSPLKLSWTGCILECAVLFGYCFLAGADNSIVRATVMAAAFAVAVRVDLSRTGANFLAAAVLCLLVFRPLDARDPGAQMSFAATLALILYAAPLARRLQNFRIPAALSEVLSATLAASIAVAPLSLIHFHRFSVVALPANLLAAPLAVLLLYGSLATAAIDAIFSPAAAYAGQACGIAAELLRTLAHLASSVDPDWRGPSPPVLLMFGCVGLVVASGWRRRALPIAGLLASLTVSGLPLGDGRLHLWFLDVGQGDSLLIETPDGRAAILDAGPAFDTFDAGERVVGEALWALGYQRVEFLAITHRHADHEGGAPFLARHFGPRHIDTNGLSDAMKDFAVTTSRRGDVWVTGGVSFRVLGPDPTWALAKNDENARSLIVEIEFGETRFLILGDASRLTERLVESDLRRQDVVKVAHHGAATSSAESLVLATAPRVALFSVGERNRFSHPNQTVVNRWRKSGARIWRTDADQTLHVISDGTRVSWDEPK